MYIIVNVYVYMYIHIHRYEHVHVQIQIYIYKQKYMETGIFTNTSAYKKVQYLSQIHIYKDSRKSTLEDTSTLPGAGRQAAIPLGKPVSASGSGEIEIAPLFRGLQKL